METPKLTKWNDLWENGILGMSEGECSDVLCHFHGRIKVSLQLDSISAESVVEDMRASVEYVKSKSKSE